MPFLFPTFLTTAPRREPPPHGPLLPPFNYSPPPKRKVALASSSDDEYFEGDEETIELIRALPDVDMNYPGVAPPNPAEQIPTPMTTPETTPVTMPAAMLAATAPVVGRVDNEMILRHWHVMIRAPLQVTGNRLLLGNENSLIPLAKRTCAKYYVCGWAINSGVFDLAQVFILISKSRARANPPPSAYMQAETVNYPGATICVVNSYIDAFDIWRTLSLTGQVKLRLSPHSIFPLIVPSAKFESSCNVICQNLRIAYGMDSADDMDATDDASDADVSLNAATTAPDASAGLVATWPSSPILAQLPAGIRNAPLAAHESKMPILGHALPPDSPPRKKISKLPSLETVGGTSLWSTNLSLSGQSDVDENIASLASTSRLSLQMPNPEGASESTTEPSGSIKSGRYPEDVTARRWVVPGGPEPGVYTNQADAERAANGRCRIIPFNSPDDADDAFTTIFEQGRIAFF